MISLTARRRRQVGAWSANGTVVLFLLVTFFPFAWLLLTSLKYPVDAFAIPPNWLFSPTLDNYQKVLGTGFLKGYWNSVVIGSVSTLVSLVLGVPAGYALARATFRGSSFLGMWILLARLAPPVAFVIPLYMLFRGLGLIDTYAGLTLAYLTITVPFVVWVMSGFFQSVPRELEEAAVIDGCSRFGAFLRVVLPLSTPGLATASIFSLMASWNEYFYPLVLGGRNSSTAPVLIASFVSFEGPNWGQLAAAGLLVVAPVLIFTFLAQGGIVRGLMGGALK